MLAQPAARRAATRTESGLAHNPSVSARLLHPAALRARAPALYRAKFVTNKGDFVIEVHRVWAPIGADRFYNLVRNGFFTDVAFYRVVPQFMVQFGVPGNPRVAAAWANANIKDDPVEQSNKRGFVSYAMGGPNTRTTQVFINFSDANSQLDSQGFAPFGQVTEGMEVVDQIYSGYGDMPDMGGHGPSPDKLAAQGNVYLARHFPLLDYIKSATIIFPETIAHHPVHHRAALKK
jgi:cyclophilin family peptidyl-prolyl cis-trans isomerase